MIKLNRCWVFGKVFEHWYMTEEVVRDELVSHQRKRVVNQSSVKASHKCPRHGSQKDLGAKVRQYFL